MVAKVLHAVAEHRQPPAWQLDLLQKILPMSKAFFYVEDPGDGGSRKSKHYG